MAQYSIKDLERLSGIQAHTIRIWEKRYQLVKPQRTPTNIRIYTDTDLKRLLNVALLNKNGFKISKISKLSDADINSKILLISGENGNISNHIESLILSMVDLNEIKFESQLNDSIRKFGFEQTVVSVLYPFLSKIGVLWQTGNILPAQEHFISNIIRRKLFAAIDQLGPYNTDNPKHKFLLLLPEGEYHEIGLLFYNYILRKMGKMAIYLGQSVPSSDLVSIQKTYNAENIVITFTTNLPENTISNYLIQTSQTFKKSRIFISGIAIENLEFKKHKNIFKIKSGEHFEDVIRKIK